MSTPARSRPLDGHGATPVARRIFDYAFSVALAIAALLLTAALPPFAGRNVFLFATAAVVIVAWFGGRGPGLLCTAMSLVLIDHYVAQQQGAAFRLDYIATIWLTGFAAVGATTSWLSGRMREARATAVQYGVAAEQAHGHLDRILATVTDAVVTLDREMRLVSFNDAARAIIAAAGGNPDTAAGRFAGEVVPVLSPAFLEESRIAFAEQRRREYEEYYAPLDRWFSVRLHPTDDVLTVVGRDVTEHKRAALAHREEETLLDTLQRIGGVLTSELELDRIVQSVTDAATELTGAQFGAFFYNLVDARGESYTLYALSGVPREAFSRFPMPRNTPIFAPTFHGTAIVRSDDITRDPRYGQVAPYHGMPPGHLPVCSYLAVPVVSRSGGVLGGLFFGHAERARFNARHERIVNGIAGWAAVAMDNARLFESERRARHEAEAASRAKSEFLAVMSHELRTPLNAIGGYAQLMAMGVRGPVSAEQTEDLERIERSQRHLLSLINDILNYARIEAGHVRYEIADIDLAETLVFLEALVSPQVRAKGVTYDVQVAACEMVVRADGEKVKQILVNLLSNAIKFTEPGGTIVVSCEEDGGRVVIAVSDTGCGIPQDRLRHIFEPFVQLDKSLTRTQEGTGLGLAISRDLAIGMDGELAVESRVGEGSVFRLALPKAGASATPA